MFCHLSSRIFFIREIVKQCAVSLGLEQSEAMKLGERTSIGLVDLKPLWLVDFKLIWLVSWKNRAENEGVMAWHTPCSFFSGVRFMLFGWFLACSHCDIPVFLDDIPVFLDASRGVHPARLYRQQPAQQRQQRPSWAVSLLGYLFSSLVSVWIYYVHWTRWGEGRSVVVTT